MKKIYQFFNNSLRSKLVILLLVIGLVPMTILSYFEIQETKATIKESFIKSTTEEVKQVDNAINLYFETIKENCKMFAIAPSVKKAGAKLTSYVGNEKKAMTPLKNGGIEAEIYTKYLNFIKSHPKTAYVYMGTKDGGYLQWPKHPFTDYDPRERPYYKTAMNNKGQVVRTSPYASADGTGAIISTVTTIEDETGKIIGVQGLDVKLKSLSKMIKDISIGDTGYVIMTTGNGTILAHPKNQELNFKSIEKLGVNKLNNLSNIKKDSFETVMNNKDYFMNVYTSPQTGWKFIVVVRQSELGKKLNSIYQKIGWLILLFAIIIVIIAVGVSKKFSRPIVAATNFAQEIAAGNLDIKSLDSKSEDEVGDLVQALEMMRTNLKEMLVDLMDTIEDLSAYSEELSASAQEGNAVIEQNTENVEQMTTSIQQISASSQEVTGLAQETNSEAEEGREKIEEIADVTEISKVVNNAVESIEQLDSNSEEIGKIVGLITKIAEQTNMLALNAAIEAARAGEHGEGFAVVAEEIRELAEETTQATTEIDELIRETQEKSKVSLKAVQQMEDKVQARKQALKETTEVFTQIKQKIENTSAHIQQTSASTQNLAESSDQMQQASEDMKNMSQEVTNSSQELANMAQELQKLVEQFNV